MFLDVVQKDDAVEVSYFDNKGGISLVQLPLPEDGYTNWEITHENDPYRDPVFTNHDGKPVKRKRSFRFYDLNLNEFLTQRISDDHKKLIHEINKINFFSVDIETEIKEEFPTPDKAHLYQILSISVTAPNLSTIVFSTKKVDEDAVNAAVQEGLKILDASKLAFLPKKPDFKVKHFFFETEKLMIEFFLTKIREVFHIIGGWNFYRYDWPYIQNRCAHLNIELEKLASPIGKKNTIKVTGTNPTEYIDLYIPFHRWVVDYQELYVNYSQIYLSSETLDNVASIELGATKLKFDMTLKELYHRDYVTFIAYAAIDTILVQLIHLKVNRTGILMNLAYYNKISVRKADGPIAQTDALIFNKFYNNKKVIADPKVEHVKTEYPGAFVKEPVRRLSDFPTGYDAKSLYPSTMKTYNLSPELYMGKCKSTQVEDLRKKGFVVTERLSVYDQSKGTGIFKELQIDLSNERTLFKSCELEIWNVIQPLIEAEAERRNLKLK